MSRRTPCAGAVHRSECTRPQREEVRWCCPATLALHPSATLACARVQREEVCASTCMVYINRSKLGELGCSFAALYIAVLEYSHRAQHLAR